MYSLFVGHGCQGHYLQLTVGSGGSWGVQFSHVKSFYFGLLEGSNLCTEVLHTDLAGP